YLVAHPDHRQTECWHRGGEEVLHLAVPELLDGGIAGGAFDATVPAPVVVGAVAVLLAVRLVVLPVVRDQIVEREAVVTGHEVDALLGLALLVAVDLGAADQAVGEAPERPARAAEEVSHVVAEPSVPLLPAVPDEATHLVQARRVPGLGEELGAGEHRVRLDVPED